MIFPLAKAIVVLMWGALAVQGPPETADTKVGQMQVICRPSADGQEIRKIVRPMSRTCRVDVDEQDGHVIVKLLSPGGVAYRGSQGVTKAGVYTIECAPPICYVSKPRAKILASAPGIATGTFVLSLGDDDEVIKLLEQVAPSQWLGVLMTPVPEPLAAHVGSQGMMIANVVVDSPADQAGLERYDIVMAFAGQQVSDMEDLTAAIADVEVGEKTEILVMHAGHTKTVNITPGERPAPGGWEYKYEEPEQEYLDQSMQFRGHRLQPGPGGTWIMEDLGGLKQIPDVFKKLEIMDSDVLKKLKDLDWDVHFEGLDPEDFKFDVRVFEGPSGEFEIKQGGKGSARVEVSVQVDDDGKVTTVKRDADGTIHVKQVTPDGEETSNTYESEEELKKQDPEAYKLYQSYCGSGAHSWIMRSGKPQRLNKARQKYQIEVQQKLQDVLKNAEKAQLKGKEAAEKAREQMEIMLKKHQDKMSSTSSESLTVEVDNGKITVTVINGERRAIHKFNSKQEFKENAPELYEKVKDLLN
ncbi:MAG: PDZ domain-containing protein [Planctomycetota bacterium]